MVINNSNNNNKILILIINNKSNKSFISVKSIVYNIKPIYFVVCLNLGR